MEYITEPWQVIVLGAGCLVFTVVAVIWFYSGIDHTVDPEELDPRSIIERGWGALWHWRPTPIMSREERPLPPRAPIVSPVVTTSTTAEQLIVTPNNEYNSQLSNNERTAFDAKAQTIAQLYEAGVVTNLSKAICKAYGCSVQAASKPDSTYQMALKSVNKYLPQKAPQFRMTPEQEANREALGLNQP